MADESVDAKSQTLLITVSSILRYCYPIVLDTYFCLFRTTLTLLLVLFLLIIINHHHHYC